MYRKLQNAEHINTFQTGCRGVGVKGPILMAQDLHLQLPIVQIFKKTRFIYVAMGNVLFCALWFSPDNHHSTNASYYMQDILIWWLHWGTAFPLCAITVLVAAFPSQLAAVIDCSNIVE
jgi:hypothetical protein